jgi:hypothetical protein
VPDYFHGQPGRLRLLRMTARGLKEIRYDLREPDEGFVRKVVVGKAHGHIGGIVVSREESRRRRYLVREERPFPSPEADSAPEDGGVEILSRAVEPGGLKFFYAAVKKGDSGDIPWETEWEKPVPPALVRVEITFAGPEGTGPPLPLRRNIFVPLGAWR